MEDNVKLKKEDAEQVKKEYEDGVKPDDLQDRWNIGHTQLIKIISNPADKDRPSNKMEEIKQEKDVKVSDLDENTRYTLTSEILAEHGLTTDFISEQLGEMFDISYDMKKQVVERCIDFVQSEQEQGNEEAAGRLDTVINTLQYFIKSATSIYKIKLDAIKEYNAITGSYAPKKAEITNKKEEGITQEKALSKIKEIMSQDEIEDIDFSHIIEDSEPNQESEEDDIERAGTGNEEF